MAFVNSIRTYSEKRLIGYTREQLFDVVAAVENYHLFVPACKRSDVIFKSRDRIQAKLEIGITPLLESYTSNVRLDKPNLITASCIEGHLFKHLETRWKFSKPPRQYSPNEICLLDFYVSFEFKSLLYKKLASSIFDEMVRLNSNSSTRMETICNSQPIVNTDLSDNNNKESKISIHSNDIINPTDHSQAESPSNHGGREAGNSVKFKRCKHGRIIIKDSSKKKSVSSQQDDTCTKDTPIAQPAPKLQEVSPSTSQQVETLKEHISNVITETQSQLQLECSLSEKLDANSTKIVTPAKVTEDLLKQSCEKIDAPGLTKPPTTDRSSCLTNEIASSSKSRDNDFCESKKEKPTDNTNSFKRRTSRSRSRSKSRSKSKSRRKRSPPRRRKSRDRTSCRERKRISSISPTHRKSPKRYRTSKSSRRFERNSRSPQRYNGSRASWNYSTTSANARKIRSRRRDLSPSPRARHVSSTDHRSTRQSARRESPVRRKSRSSHSSSMSISSRSRSSSKSHVEYNLSNPSSLNKDNVRTLEKESIDRFSCNPTQGTTIRKTFDKSIKSPNNQIIHQSNLPKQMLATSSNSIYDSKPETNRSHTTQLSQINEKSSQQQQQQPKGAQSTNSNNQSVRSARPHTSPNSATSAQSSYAPSTDNSPSSEIYDPEGPIIPISLVDSPPLSPVIKTKAASNVTNVFRDEGEKNDDDVPSSAVELNHQEKYLQKLNRQERVVEEVKIALKPHYRKRGGLNKEQYKDVLRRAVPKICHSRNGEINPIKIRKLVEAYVKKMKRRKL